MKSPLLHFFLLGALLYALRLAWPASHEPIEISATDLQRLRAEWTLETHRPPNAAEMDALVRGLADEETLFREALRLRLDHSDPVVRTRLARNMSFIGGAETRQADESALVEQALALGMARSDVLVRRRLVQVMQQRAAEGVRIDEHAVRDYVAQNPQRYGGQMRVSFTQRAAGGPMPALLARGFSRASEADVARSLGPDFARAVMGAPQGRWSPPIRSPYGMLEVYVSERVQDNAPAYSVVRNQAYYALLEERERQAVEAMLRDLRERYPVQVDRPLLAVAGLP